MDSLPILAARFGVALGIGLLIGAERERHKRLAHHTVSAGVRTITLIALLGSVGAAIARAVGDVAGALLLVGIAVSVTALIVTGYRRGGSEEPGMTTEVAALLTLFLGALAMYQPAAAASLAVVVAIVLVARTSLHNFVTSVLSQQELQDALVLLAATLVVLPLLPTHALDPLGAFVPSAVWTVAVAVMAIGTAGHVARRALGPTYGLPVVGLASGFVSSVATIVAMGAEARRHPERERPAVAGATLSTLSTIIQLSLIVSLADVTVLQALLPVLVPAGLVAAVYGAFFTFRATRSHEKTEAAPSRAFDPKIAIAFALGVSAMLFLSALARYYLGPGAALAATALAGLADAHGASFSVASLASHGGLTAQTAALGALLAFTTNTLTKFVAAWLAGGRRFFALVAPGLALVLVAAWAGALFAGLV